MSNFSFELIAHELAHQWFGDKATCSSWGEIWLNEGFATFSESIAYEYARDYAALENWKTNNLTGFGQPTSGALNAPNGSVFCDDTTSVNRIFDDRLTYGKGGYLLRMLRYKLGDAAFFSAIRNYIADSELSYKFATTSLLQRHLEQVSGQPLTRFFANWLYGKGYPTFNITHWQPSIDTVYVRVDQTGSDASNPVFEADMPLTLVYTQPGNQMLKLSVASASTLFKIPTRGVVDSIQFDTDRILAAKGRVTKITATTGTLSTKRALAYPNPAHGSFYLSGPTNTLKRVQALALDGRVLRTWPSSPVYRLQDMPAQAIILRIEDGAGVYSQLLKVQ